MTQSRVSVREVFSKYIKVSPSVMYINGQPEWVDNFITFGDLIEEHMGKEARDFYFESIYDLLLEGSRARTFVDISDEEEDKVTEDVSIVTPKPISKSKSNKQSKPVGRRLF